jgi:hypothetical protein
MRKPIGFLVLCPMETRIYHAPDAVSGVPPTASAQKNAKSTSTNPSVAAKSVAKTLGITTKMIGLLWF